MLSVTMVAYNKGTENNVNTKSSLRAAETTTITKKGQKTNNSEKTDGN